jgi:hypothetical protein
VDLELDPLILVMIIVEHWKENVTVPAYATEINDRGGSAALTMQHPSMRNNWH